MGEARCLVNDSVTLVNGLGEEWGPTQLAFPLVLPSDHHIHRQREAEEAKKEDKHCFSLFVLAGVALWKQSPYWKVSMQPSWPYLNEWGDSRNRTQCPSDKKPACLHQTCLKLVMCLLIWKNYDNLIKQTNKSPKTLRRLVVAIFPVNQILIKLKLIKNESEIKM